MDIILVIVLLTCIWTGAYAASQAHNHQTLRNKQPLQSTIALLGLSSTACIVSAHLFTSLVFAHLSVWIFLYLVARWAQRGKGAAILTIGTFFVILDSAALFSLAIWPNQQLATSTIILLAAFGRLMVPFTSWWFRLLDRVSPVFIAIIFVSLLAPCGAWLAIKAKPLFPALESTLFSDIALFILTSTSMLTGALNLMWHRKDFAFFSISVFALYSPAFFFIESNELLVTLIACLILTTIFNLSIYSRLDRNKQYSSLCFMLSFALILAVPGLGVGTPFWMAFHHFLAQHAHSFSSLTLISLILWASAFFIFIKVAIDISLRVQPMETKNLVLKNISWPQFAQLFVALVLSSGLMSWWAYAST